MDNRPPPADLDEPAILCLEVPDDLSEIEDVDERAALVAAIAEADAGRVISHEAMTRWMRSWGTAHELPPPECGE